MHVSIVWSGADKANPSCSVRDVDVDDGATVDDMIRSLGLVPTAYVAALDDTVVPRETALRDGVTCILIRVVAGG